MRKLVHAILLSSTFLLGGNLSGYADPPPKLPPHIEHPVQPNPQDPPLRMPQPWEPICTSQKNIMKQIAKTASHVIWVGISSDKNDVDYPWVEILVETPDDEWYKIIVFDRRLMRSEDKQACIIAKGHTSTWAFKIPEDKKKDEGTPD
jgi:hypothetical protein